MAAQNINWNGFLHICDKVITICELTKANATNDYWCNWNEQNVTQRINF